MEAVSSLSNIPINSAVLKALLSHLRYPKNKISDMEKSGELIRLKKDLYVGSKSEISKDLIANYLYGISYVSLETALASYGLIPERVYAVRSVTTKRAKKFSTPLGIFDFVTVPEDYFSIGIRQEIVENKYAFLIAEPTKAICDMLVTTRGLRLQSVRAMQAYLEDDLRIDFSDANLFDTGIVRQCIETGKKKTELIQLLKFLEP